MREISIISSPTSACMAQSSRGALETWSESSALLVVFCSTAESPGPPSSLANCCTPPRALCAIKGNCANDVQRRGNTSPLPLTEVDMCARQIRDAINRAATFPQQQDATESNVATQAFFYIKGLCNIHPEEQN